MKNISTKFIPWKTNNIYDKYTLYNLSLVSLIINIIIEQYYNGYLWKK